MAGLLGFVLFVLALIALMVTIGCCVVAVSENAEEPESRLLPAPPRGRPYTVWYVWGRLLRAVVQAVGVGRRAER